jgi:hypothetical protein
VLWKNLLLPSSGYFFALKDKAVLVTTRPQEVTSKKDKIEKPTFSYIESLTPHISYSIQLSD